MQIRKKNVSSLEIFSKEIRAFLLMKRKKGIFLVSKLELASIGCNTKRMAWDGTGMGWNEMGRDPVIAVIVISRDPTTHLNYLYLGLS